MDGPGTYSQPPYAGGSKDESGTAAKDTISIGSGDRVSGEDRMGMEVHQEPVEIASLTLQESEVSEVCWFDLDEVWHEIRTDRSRFCVPTGGLRVLRELLEARYDTNRITDVTIRAFSSS